MRFSLRELVVLPAVFAVAALALYFANPVVSGVTVIATGLTLLMMLARALALNAAARCFAAAFLIAAMAYVGTFITVSIANTTLPSGWAELNTYTASLPTAHAIRPLYQEVVRRRSYWIGPDGEVSKTKPPTSIPNTDGRGGGRAPAVPPVGAIGGWKQVSLPLPSDFMTVAHALWALLFGWLAGKHAAWLYRRRVASEASVDRSSEKPRRGESA